MAITFAALPIKLFPRDVIGPKPKKAGDTFKAMFFGQVTVFVADEISHGCIMAVRA